MSKTARPARMTDAALGRRLRIALAGAKASLLRDEPHRRCSCYALSFMAGYLKDDAEVAALLNALARVEFDQSALGDVTPVAPIPAP